MIRGIFFKFFFYLGFVLICIIFLPSLIMPSNIASFGGKLSGYWAKFCLRIFLSTKIIVKGLEMRIASLASMSEAKNSSANEAIKNMEKIITNQMNQNTTQPNYQTLHIFLGL